MLRPSVCSTGEEVNKKAMDTFTELSRDLRQLRDLPLSITSLQGTSPTFRYTEVNSSNSFVLLNISIAVSISLCVL